MRRIGLLLASALLMVSCGGIESEAKKQLRESLRHEAVVPESVKISDEEVVFKNDSLCVIDFVVRQTKEGGPVKENKEYMYARLYDGTYEYCYFRGEEPFGKRIAHETELWDGLMKSFGDTRAVTNEEIISSKCKSGRKVK